MSNNHSIPLYPEIPVDREAAIALIHGLQVDLSILAALLARDSEPTLQMNGIKSLSWVRNVVNRYIPETRRH